VVVALEMLMSKKIPDQIYVVSQNRPETEYTKDPVTGVWSTKNVTDHNFGFLHPHEPTKATDAKRKSTQHSWAYYGLYEKNGEFWEKGTDWKYDPVMHSHSSVPYDRPIDPLYAPRIWDNVPMAEFKIIDTVNRYRGNKLFKVLDPRGVEFEITVQSLYHLLQESTVRNGVILDECVWMKGKDLVVARSLVQ
jgi:hypothetical protein